MTEVLTPYAIVPNWSRKLIGNSRIFEFWYFLHERANNKTRELWHRQETLAEEFGVSVRTVSRWISYLRDIGALITRYRWGARGKRLSDLIKLAWHDPREHPPAWDDQARDQPACRTGDAHKGTKPTTSTSLRSVEVTDPSLRSVNSSLRSVDGDQLLDQSDAQSTKRADEMAHKVSPGQASLFTEDELDQLDANVPIRETSTNEVSRAKKEGTPTRRTMAYWLSGRVSRPERHVILGMGRAIKQCIESGVPEEEVRQALDTLMGQGLDIFPRHLLLRFGLAKFGNRKTRDYQKNPLFKHSPKSPTTTPARRLRIFEEEQRSVASRSISRTPESEHSSNNSSRRSDSDLKSPPTDDIRVDPSVFQDRRDPSEHVSAEYALAQAREQGWRMPDPNAKKNALASIMGGILKARTQHA